MHKILILSGDKSIGGKIETLDLNNLSVDNMELIFEQKINLSTQYRVFFEYVESLQKDKQLTKLSDFMFVYNISKYMRISASMKIRNSVVLLGNYKISSIKSFVVFLRHFFKTNTIFSLFANLLGIFHIPERFVLVFLSSYKNYRDNLIEVLSKLELENVVLFSSGYDNLIFLINTIQKNSNIKFILILNNWDNPSSKSFVSQNFIKIALWNRQQIKHILAYNKISRSTLKVIGSKTADDAYRKYITEIAPILNQEKTLLYIGQQNSYDEIGDLLRIQNYLNDNPRSYYRKLAYRPHPLSRMKMKRLNLHKNDIKNIDVVLGSSIDLRKFDGIICLPTTLVLEVVLSKKPAIIYTPKSQKYRRDPAQMWNYDHFNEFKQEGFLKVIKDFNQLKNYLEYGLPMQKEFNQSKLEYFFPFYTENYTTRFSQLVQQIVYPNKK